MRFVFDESLPEPTGQLTAAVAEHFAGWLLNPPVVIYTQDSELHQLAGSIDERLGKVACVPALMHFWRQRQYGCLGAGGQKAHRVRTRSSRTRRTVVDKTKLIQRLMATFLDELDEHVPRLQPRSAGPREGRDPLGAHRVSQDAVPHGPQPEGGGSLGQPNSAGDACHQLEDLLAAGARRSAVPGPGELALLFETADAIEEAGRGREERDVPARRWPPCCRDWKPPPRQSSPSPPVLRGRGVGGEGAESSPDPTPHPRPLAPEYRGEGRETVPPLPEYRGEGGRETAKLAAMAGTVRVSADKLGSTFLARDGELLVARRRVQLRLEDAGRPARIRRRWADGAAACHRTDLEDVVGQEWSRDGRCIANGRSPRAWRRSSAGRDELRQAEKDLAKPAPVMAGDHRLLKQTADALDNELAACGTPPFADACQGLDRMVREPVQSGERRWTGHRRGAIELDRSILEKG